MLLLLLLLLLLQVLVTGSSGSGKSSVCHILCNYALRCGWTPLFLELDPRYLFSS